MRTREINQPEIAHFLFQYLPLIDKHNKQRQSILNLEKSWPTQSADQCLTCMAAKMPKSARGLDDSSRATQCHQGLSIDFGFVVQASKNTSCYRENLGFSNETCYVIISDHFSGTLYAIRQGEQRGGPFGCSIDDCSAVNEGMRSCSRKSDKNRINGKLVSYGKYRTGTTQASCTVCT